MSDYQEGDFESCIVPFVCDFFFQDGPASVKDSYMTQPELQPVPTPHTMRCTHHVYMYVWYDSALNSWLYTFK